MRIARGSQRGKCLDITLNIVKGTMRETQILRNQSRKFSTPNAILSPASGTEFAIGVRSSIKCDLDYYNFLKKQRYDAPSDSRSSSSVEWQLEAQAKTRQKSENFYYYLFLVSFFRLLSDFIGLKNCLGWSPISAPSAVTLEVSV